MSSEIWYRQDWYERFDKPADIKKFTTPVAKFLRMHLDLPRAANVQGAVWNDMALTQINTPESVKLSVHNKARQRGWSFNEAAIAVARSIIYPRSNTIFISFNEKESTNKIRYCLAVIDALRPAVRPRIDKSNETTLVPGNGSRIESLPCKDPRGMAQPYIVLDEYAMYNEHAGKEADKKILIASFGALGQSGCIRVGSTPKPTGIFRELADPAFNTSDGTPLKGGPPPVYEWPWWSFGDLCRDRRSAKLNAPHLTTEQRVERYGTEKLQEIYSQFMFLGDISGFQQEYECAWIAEAAQFIPQHCIQDAIRDYPFPAEPPPTGITVVGADFGRRQDSTAFVVLHADNDRLRVLEIVRLRGTEAPEQRDRLDALLQRYNPFVVPMDVGDGFAQGVWDDLHYKWPSLKPVNFSNRQYREETFATMLTAFVNGYIEIPRADQQLAADAESLRKIHTASGQISYEAPRSAKGHADSVYALAMAIREMPRMSARKFSYATVQKRDVDWSRGAAIASDRGNGIRTVTAGPDRSRGGRSAWGDW